MQKSYQELPMQKMHFISWHATLQFRPSSRLRSLNYVRSKVHQCKRCIFISCCDNIL